LTVRLPASTAVRKFDRRPCRFPTCGDDGFKTLVDEVTGVYLTRYARGEAMRRGKSVTICRTVNYTAASPACSTGNGSAVGGWMEGWVVFLDSNGNGTFDAATDIVLRAQEPMAGISDFFAVGVSTPTAVGTGNRIIYDGTGRAIGQSGRWLVHASGSFATNAYYTRTLCMNSVGRVKVQTGDVACS
jgi:type IV fimbrial biogenesis protein FimT